MITLARPSPITNFFFITAILLNIGAPNARVVESAHAAELSTTGIVRGSLDRFVVEFHDAAATPMMDGARESRAFSSQSFSVELADASRYWIEFDRVMSKTWNDQFTTEFGIVEDASAAVFFQGHAIDSQDASRVPASGALYVHDDSLSLSIHFAHRSQVLHLRVPVDENRDIHPVMVRRANMEELQHVRCGTMRPHLSAIGASDQAGHLHPDKPPVARSTGARVIELATDADAQWYGRYGINSNNRIAEIVNAVSTLFQRDLGIEVTVVAQNVWTNAGSQPYTSSDAEVLLDQFGNYTNANGHLGSADSYHLFTGKDLHDGTIGIAWMGVICSDPLYSFGLTQQFSDPLDHLITAHELGHSLNADHDTATPRSLMYPSIGETQNFFSDFSIAEIQTFVSEHGDSCMPGDSTPEPRVEDPRFTLAIGFDSRRGTMNGRVTRTGYSRGCAHALEWSRARNFSRVSVKGIRTGNFTSIAFRAAPPKKIRAKRSEPNRAYVRVKATCNGVVYRSPAKAVGAPRSTSKSYSSLANWISRANRPMRVTSAR